MKTAMILAAGRGERLKPLTNFIPKAMCQVYGKPLIEYHVANLARSGFKRIVINHAYLGGQIRQHLGNGKRWNIEICYSPEPPGGLETGGGIVNALPLLGQEPFLVVNGDIYTDFDFTTLNCLPNFLAHVILVSNPAHNLKGDFNLESLRLTNERRYTYAGITCYRPELFHQCPIGRYSVTPLLRELATQQKISGSVYEGVWADIGSPKQLNDFKLPVKTDRVA
ncbi:N-acetylmuramate alpha-1-phosphate uridylyltransferase MurU [Legionella gresilensis]|uniref:N-acetylmuramate alpha-1-phosphate uridylyltransferase MurU n=1 Tax=Legionella gresilensis TaxID=91823 RepID=UPI0010418C6C|nr:nucleotidyltransferase family protein [Legionella gresilensis]